MFSAGNPVHSIWYLKLYPKGVSTESKQYVICDLIRIKGSFNGSVNIGINIVSSDRRMKSCVLSTKNRIFLWKKVDQLYIISLDSFDEREFFEVLLPDDTLILKCHLKFEDISPQYEAELRKLSETIYRLYDNKEFSDLTLYTSDKEFSLHQAIICQRAPALLEDLRFEIENSKNYHLKVDSMSTSALNGLLMYLYSGRLDEISPEILPEMYDMAEKYNFMESSELICSLGSTSTVCTQLKVVRKHMKWDILDVTKYMADGIVFQKYINLDTFKFLVKANVEFYGRINHIEMGIRCVSKLEKDIVLSCKISLRFPPGKYIKNFDENVLIFFAADNENKDMLYIKHSCQKEDTKSLELFLNLALTDCQEHSSVEGVSFPFPERPSIFGMGLLSHDLTTQFEINQSKQKGDVTLVFNDKKIHANKAILSSWSPVFSRMFHHDMTEKYTDEVVIADTDFRTARRLIRYMYSGIITQHSFPEDSKLYTAADKYQISSLFRRCSELLRSELTIENACEILVLSHLHSDIDLFESVLLYIKNNQKEILCSSGWKLLSDTNLLLASSVQAQW